MKKQGGRRLNVSGVLRHLGVSRSGYNSWKNKIPSDREHRKNVIKNKICDIYDESKQNYGAPKITKKLRETGEIISEKTVGNYMREMGLKAQWVKPYTITTIDSDFSEEYKNILAEQFNPERPDAMWCSDITYIWTHEGFVYLTSIMDLYSRKIISWVLSDTLETKWLVEAVNKAKVLRHVDNYRLIFEYIEAFYNTVRIHSHCEYISPNEYEKKYWQKLRHLEIEVA